MRRPALREPRLPVMGGPRIWLLLALGLLALAAAAVWRLPAGVALAGARDGLPELSWNEVQGTVWRGRAEGLRWRGVRLGRLEWELLDFEFGRGGNSHWRIHGASPQHEFSLGLSAAPGGALTLHEVRGYFPAPWIDLSAIAPLLYAEGRVTADLAHLSLRDRRAVSAGGALSWSDAALQGPTSIDLGDIDAHVRPTDTGDEQAIEFDVKSAGSRDLAFSGNGRIEGGTYQLALEFAPAPHRDDLRKALTAWGAVRENGTIAIQLEGRMHP